MNTDFLIIGGGIAGVSVAAELSAHGSVILVEAEDHLAHHASSRSAALYEPYYGPPPIVELSLASGAALVAAGVLSPRGTMLVSGLDGVAAFKAEQDAFHMDPITPDEAVARFPALDPGKVAAAAYADHAQDIDTDLLIQCYARKARENGAKILLRAPVTAIAPGWRVTVPQGEIIARTLVNAAGPWADRVAAMAGVAPLGVVPKRRSMARIPAPGGLDVASWPMVFGLAEGFYAKPDAGALIVSPCDADPMEPHDAWADDMVLAEGLARYEELARFPVDRLLSSWAGLRTFAPDGAPAYGRDPAAAEFAWFAGQGGYGFQSAPAAARFLADSLLGRPTDAALAAALSPARFRA